MKNFSLFNLLLGLTLPLGLAGCGKPEPEKAPLVQPTPAPKAASNDDGKEFSAKDIRHKADQAANSLEKFLKDQDPKLRDKVQRLADKVSDKLGKDKDRWREKLQEKRRELQPQIEQLREQLGQVAGDKNKEKLKDALSKLEGKSQDADKKLAELETAGADAWRQFKAQWKEDAAKDDRTPPVDPADPTPKPTPER